MTYNSRFARTNSVNRRSGFEPQRRCSHGLRFPPTPALSAHQRFSRCQRGSFTGSGGRHATSPALPRKPEIKPFELDEITIADLQAGMASGKFTARSITEKYLARIEEIDKKGPALNSVLEVNPDALAIADALDQERKERHVRGPMHGIPVLIKDNIDTADRMQTTAGSLALLGSKPTKDSFVAQKLRESGAVILGKTNLSEWANIRSSHSSSGWSGRGGQTDEPLCA